MVVINIVSLAAQLYIRWRGVETPEYGIHGNGYRPRELDPFCRMYSTRDNGANQKRDNSNLLLSKRQIPPTSYLNYKRQHVKSSSFTLPSK
jgi:hypothetical protein